jgi:hypothetical protein
MANCIKVMVHLLSATDHVMSADLSRRTVIMFFA